jgi:SAM-dependent methyltransferase
MHWMAGDAHYLRLDDARFDLVLLHTLLSHVRDPARVLAEATRVLKPSGTLVIFDGDYATLTYGTDDRDYGERMDQKIIQAMITNPRIMRSAPRLLRRLGLRLVWSHCQAFNEIGKADFFLASLKAYLVVLPGAGTASREEVEAFVGDQMKASDVGAFFGGYNFVTYICKPDL